MKKILSLFLAITMLITGMSSIPVMASEIVKSGSCGDDLSWSLDSDGLLTISGTGAMDDYSNGSWSYSPWGPYSEEINEQVKSLKIDEGVTYIGNYAFWKLSDVKEIIIPETVTSIGEFAFWDCSSATVIKIPDSVNELKSGTFMGCDSLATINIGKNVSIIDDYAFGYISGIEQFVVDEENEYYTAIDGVLYNKDETKLIKYTTGSTDTEYIIPDGTLEIERCAFCEAFNLESIVFPEGITEITGSIFYSMEGLSLKSITLPSTIASISLDFADISDFTIIYNGNRGAWEQISGIDGLSENVNICFGTEELREIVRTSLEEAIIANDLNAVSNILINDGSILKDYYEKIDALTADDMNVVAEILCNNQYASDEQIDAAIAIQHLNSKNTTYNIDELYEDIGIGSSEIINICREYITDSIQELIDEKMLSYNQYGSIDEVAYYYDESTFLAILQKAPSVSVAKEIIDLCIDYWGWNDSRYFRLDENGKNEVACECIGRTYSSMEVFRNVFYSKVEQVYAQNSSSSSSGGGSGGGGSSSGGGGAVSGGEDSADGVMSYTRASICAKIVDDFGFTLNDTTVESPFADVDETNEYYEAILICNQLGIVNGYEDGTFKPEGGITNAEVAKLIYNVLSYVGWDVEVPEDADYDKTMWYGQYAWLAEDLGIMINVESWFDVTTADNITCVFSDIGSAYQNHLDDIDVTEYKFEIDNYIVLKDDEQIECEIAPTIIDGAIYITPRVLAETFDIIVEYNDETKEVIFRGWNKIIKYTLGEGNCVVINGRTLVNAENFLSELIGDEYSITADDTYLVAIRKTTSGTTPEETPEVTPEVETCIKVGSITTRKGKEIVIPIRITNNVGLTGLQLNCDFDNVLTLTNVEVGNALSNLEFTTPGDLSSNNVTFLWDGMDADSSNGEVLYLTFNVSDEAVIGTYNITLTVNTACDQNLDDVNVVTKSGKVNIIEFIPGDVNEDDEVNVKDIILIRRYIAGGYDVELVEPAANVDENEEINVKDIILLRRFIAGGYGVELN